MKQFPVVDCSRGAPMGRWADGSPVDCPDHSISVFLVNLYGDYDDGGAYWGAWPALPLYCARYGEVYQDFTRANSRKEAIELMIIPTSKLKRKA